MKKGFTLIELLIVMVYFGNYQPAQIPRIYGAWSRNGRY